MKHWIALILAGVAFSAAAECMKTGSVCVEPGGTRIVNGIPVTRECWAWEDEYTCLTEDAGVDGCATLNAARVEAACIKKAGICKESVTDVDGKTVCLSETEHWMCEKTIELPALNAEWTSKTEEVLPSVDWSACEELHENAACRETNRTCVNGSAGECTQFFQCGERDAKGCTALAEGGCQQQGSLTCDPDSPDCAVQTGTFVCVGKLPATVVEAGRAGDVEVTDDKVTSSGAPAEDLTACTAAQDTGCKLTRSVCSEAGGRRVINGKVYYAPCWGYTKTYTCEGEGETSTCTALEADKRCRKESGTCLETGPDGMCRKAESIYVCGTDASVIEPGDAELIENVTTNVGDVSVSDCGALTEDASCRKTEEVCAESVTLSDGTVKCLKNVVTFLCGNGGTGESDECKAYAENSHCREVKTECLATDAAGACTLTTKTYVCRESATDETVGETCGDTVCIAGLCEAAKDEVSTDFAKSAALLEVVRQAAAYGDIGADQLFSGEESGCTVKAAGFSCCRSATAEESVKYSNTALATALTVGVDAAWEAVKYAGSPYVYDMLSSTPAASGLLHRLYGNAASGAYSPSLSYYGVTASVSNGSLTLSFSPGAFIFSAGLEMAQEYFSCTKDDQLHALRRSQNLCHYVGSWCAKKGGVLCLEKKEAWCCFNSRLALAVQEGARAQLGLGWGDPEKPDCRGLTVAEFELLDFSKIDLTAVVADIAHNAEDKARESVAAVLERATERTNAAAADTSVQKSPPEGFTGKCAAGYAAGRDGTCVREDGS